MKHQIDPTVDCVFKAILGKEENKNLLIHFLNAILRRNGAQRIVDVVIANPYNEREFQQGKLSIVDVKALDRDGHQYQIEVQRAIHASLAERMLFSWSAIYHGQLKKGDSFLHLRPVISIWLLRGALYDDIDDYHLPFGVYNLRHRRRLSDRMAIHVLQLPKWQHPTRRPDTRDRWMYFFKEGKQLDPAHPPDLLRTKEMTQAMQVLTEFSDREKNYLLYEQRLEAERVELTWRAQREQLEQALRKHRQKEQQLLQENERAQQEKERAQQEKERAQQEKERAQQEKERLRALLLKAGIDPNEQLPNHELTRDDAHDA